MKRFKPTWHIETIYDIQSADLIKHHFKGVIVDLDNTLIPWNEPDYSRQMVEWINEIHSNGIKIYLLSNNNPERVARVAKPLRLPHQARALKPFKKAFGQALHALKLPKDQVVVIGDQAITDIWGANRMGLASILVKPLVPNDNIYTFFNRTMEKGILKRVGIDRDADWGKTLD